MSEKKKMIIMIVVAALIISIIPIVYFVNAANSKKELEKFQEYIQTKDAKYLYFGREGCTYCQLFDPEFEVVNKHFSFDALYIDTDKLVSKDLNTMLATLGIDGSDFGTPYSVIVQDGEKVAEHVGAMTDKELFDFLQENGILNKEEKFPVDYLDFDSYKKVIASSKNEILVIAQMGCDGCIQARPVLWDIASEYGLTIHYLNATELDEEEGAEFEKSIDYFSNNAITTPMMIIVNQGKAIDVTSGIIDKDTYVKFLTENGFIKE